MAKGKSKDPLGRNREIAVLRKRMDKKLHVHGMFADLTPELSAKLSEASAYADYRRIENERQLESIKALMAGYMFNDRVVIQETVVDKDGDLKVVGLSAFDAMLKAVAVFLAAMNMQNKMWGLYAPPQSPKGEGDRDGPTNIRNLTITLVQEMQRIAANRKTLPVAATVLENGK